MDTPTPGVSVTPACENTAGCKGGTESASSGGGALLLLVVVLVLLLAAATRGRGRS